MSAVDRPFWVMHLRLPPWRVACGHRDARRALPSEEFRALPEKDRCLRCQARNRLMLERDARRRERREIATQTSDRASKCYVCGDQLFEHTRAGQDVCRRCRAYDEHVGRRATGGAS